MTDSEADLLDYDVIDHLTERFFGLFCNKNGREVSLDEIFELCIPQTMIIKACGPMPEITGLKDFIEPRQKLLTSGELTDFDEEELEGTTHIYGSIATRQCVFRKAGLMNGAPFEGRGHKNIQFVKMPDGWKISAVAWDEES